MEQSRLAELLLELKHRHEDGSWSSLEPRREHHDAADHDPETGWVDGRIYACPTCDEQVVVRESSGSGTVDWR